jgi:hypothetical protein
MICRLGALWRPITPQKRKWYEKMARHEEAEHRKNILVSDLPQYSLRLIICNMRGSQKVSGMVV